MDSLTDTETVACLRDEVGVSFFAPEACLKDSNVHEVAVLEGDELPQRAIAEVQNVEVLALVSTQVDRVERARPREPGPAKLDPIDVGSERGISCHADQAPYAPTCRASLRRSSCA
jgi:hypothetical protein